MKLLTSYKKLPTSAFPVDIDISELPKPHCGSPYKITEAIVIDGFKFWVEAILYRHAGLTELFLMTKENVSKHNQDVLAKAKIEDFIDIRANIGNTEEIVDFKSSSIPHSYKEFLEKDGLVYEVVLVLFKDNLETEIIINKKMPLAPFYQSYLGTGVKTDF